VAGDPHVAGGTGALPGGGTAAAGEPQVGAGAADGDADPPHDGDEAAEVFAGEAAGWSQLGPAGGGTTIVGATGCAAAGGAHVEATPAVWLFGDAGRTGGAAFFFLWRRRVLR
jgi:hypothetical protein